MNPQTPKWKEFLHKLLVGGLGYVPGVCWKILRFQEDLEDPKILGWYTHIISPSASWIFEPSIVPIGGLFLALKWKTCASQIGSFPQFSVFNNFENHLHSGAILVVNEIFHPSKPYIHHPSCSRAYVLKPHSRIRHAYCTLLPPFAKGPFRIGKMMMMILPKNYWKFQLITWRTFQSTSFNTVCKKQ